MAKQATIKAKSIQPPTTSSRRSFSIPTISHTVIDLTSPSPPPITRGSLKDVTNVPQKTIYTHKGVAHDVTGLRINIHAFDGIDPRIREIVLADAFEHYKSGAFLIGNRKNLPAAPNRAESNKTDRASKLFCFPFVLPTTDIH